MGNPFLAGGSGGSSSSSKSSNPFLAGGKGKSSRKKKSGGIGGFIHDVGHGIATTGDVLEKVLVQSAVGLGDLAVAGGKDIGQGKGVLGLVTYPVAGPLRGALGKDTWAGGRSNLDKAAEPVLKSQYHSFGQTIHHPGKDPVADALNVLFFASAGAGTLARGSNAAKALSAGDKAAALKALTFPTRESRYLKAVNPETGEVFKIQRGSYSKSALTRTGQKAVDKARGTKYEGRNAKLIGREINRNAQIEHNLLQLPANKLKLKTKKMTDVEATAIQVQAEGVHIPVRIARIQEELATGKLSKRAVRRSKQEIAYLTQAKNLIDDTGVAPKIKDPKLAALYDEVANVANKREQMLIDAGALTPEQALFRKYAPGRLYLGAEFDGKVLTGAEHFNPDLVPDLVRIPHKYSAAQRISNRVPGIGNSGVVGITRKPGSLVHGFYGVVQRHGGGSKKIGKLVADDYLEAARWWNSDNTRAIFRKIGVEDPNLIANQNPIAVRIEKNIKIRPDLKALIAKSDDGHVLSAVEKREIQRHLGNAFEDIFPKNIEIEPQKGIVWIPKAMLGKLDRAPLGATVERGSGFAKAVTVWDEINNAQKFAVLFTKAAYAVPNMIGNLAATIIEQGFAAPANLARASRLNAKLGPELAASIDTVVNEGLFASLKSPGGTKVAQTLVNVFAHAFGRVVDVPFRRASFLHAARVRGFKTPKQLEDLFNDPKFHDDLLEITKESNRNIIDYANLSDVERTIIRRLIFFYPWVKGSTVYTARFAREHPFQALSMYPIGQHGADIQEQAFGELPSYAKSLYPTGGGSSGFPRALDFRSASLFGSPFEIFSAFTSPEKIAGNLSPAAGFVNTIVSGKNRLGFEPYNESNFTTAIHDLYKSTPPYVLAKRTSGEDQTGNLYQYTPRDAILQWLLSKALVPTTVNKAKANQQAEAGR